MVFVYTTCQDVAQAKELGHKIVETRHAAAVSIWPAEVIYRWEGEVRERQEAILLVETNEPRVASIEEFLIKNHTYSTPLVAMVDVRRLNREYKDWMTQVVAS